MPLVSTIVLRAVVPSMNTTLPVGTPTPGLTALTVAVKVTLWPNKEGLVAEVTLVLLPALLTVCVTAPDVLVLKLASPLYTAVIVCEATARSAVE